MIIFDLDGTLADCEHRRHFVHAPEYNDEYDEYFCPDHELNHRRAKAKYVHKQTGELWKPDWPAFFSACDKDTPIKPVIELFQRLWMDQDIQIWSGRCESTREKTLKWLREHIEVSYFRSEKYFDERLKMRPIGDNTPDDQLKNRWLEEHIAAGAEPIEFVFDDRPKVVRMWRKNGIFVFDANQTGNEF